MEMFLVRTNARKIDFCEIKGMARQTARKRENVQACVFKEGLRTFLLAQRKEQRMKEGMKEREGGREGGREGRKEGRKKERRKEGRKKERKKEKKEL